MSSRRKRMFVSLICLMPIMILIIFNSFMAKKGFYYDATYPYSDFVLFDGGKSFVGVPGSRSTYVAEKDMGRGMAYVTPNTMQDRKYGKDSCISVGNTFYFINMGEWLGIRFGEQLFMLQWKRTENEKKNEYYRYFLGRPFWKLQYAGKERNYPREVEQDWLMKINLGYRQMHRYDKLDDAQ